MLAFFCEICLTCLVHLSLDYSTYTILKGAVACRNVESWNKPTMVHFRTASIRQWILGSGSVSSFSRMTVVCMYVCLWASNPVKPKHSKMDWPVEFSIFFFCTNCWEMHLKFPFSMETTTNRIFAFKVGSCFLLAVEAFKQGWTILRFFLFVQYTIIKRLPFKVSMIYVFPYRFLFFLFEW